VTDASPDLNTLRERARSALDRLLPEVEHAGVTVTEEGRRRLLVFVDALLDTGRELNLVSRRQLPMVVENHVAPSLMPLLAEPSLAVEGAAVSYLDVGSGGGFPGAVLAAVRPEWRVVLVDSIGKKARFLRDATARFDNVTVIRDRVEALVGTEHGGTFDLATSRAVSTVDVVWPWVRRVLAVEGELLVYVRGDAVDEQSALAVAAAGRMGDLLPPIRAPWCDGALVRVRRAR
jgi:16S rRNA (guanine527-N7)-methyltransferase